MSTVRVCKNNKLVRNLGLMASAAILSLMMAGEAQAACTTNNAQPASAVVVDGTGKERIPKVKDQNSTRC